MKDTGILRFLYGTAFGRILLKLLVQPKVSKVASAFLKSGLSRPMIWYYRHKYHIDMTDIDVPMRGFDSFNDFFTRKRREIPRRSTAGRLISPCDGFLSVADIKGDTVFHVKHTKFTIGELLKDNNLAKEFIDGKALIFRLTPANYHRYCYVADGEVLRLRRIPGKLHCVRPIATESIPVFVQNSREYQVLQTQDFGKMVQMEVGALLVGKISNHERFREGSIVWSGDEKGYFEFGGSTIILLLQRDEVTLRSRIQKALDGNEGGEIAVRMGEVIGEML